MSWYAPYDYDQTLSVWQSDYTRFQRVGRNVLDPYLLTKYYGSNYGHMLFGTNTTKPDFRDVIAYQRFGDWLGQVIQSINEQLDREDREQWEDRFNETGSTTYNYYQKEDVNSVDNGLLLVPAKYTATSNNTSYQRFPKPDFLVDKNFYYRGKLLPRDLWFNPNKPPKRLTWLLVHQNREFNVPELFLTHDYQIGYKTTKASYTKYKQVGINPIPKSKRFAWWLDVMHHMKEYDPMAYDILATRLQWYDNIWRNSPAIVKVRERKWRGEPNTIVLFLEWIRALARGY